MGKAEGCFRHWKELMVLPYNFNQSSFGRCPSVYASDEWKGVDSIYDACDGISEDSKCSSELALAVAELLRSLVVNKDARGSCYRFLTLIHHLCPDPIDQSLSESSRQIGCTRANLSKIGLSIRDKFRLIGRYHRSNQARISYRQTQLRCLKAGNHASQLRKRKKPITQVDTIDSVNEKPRSSQRHLPSPPAQATG